jgi:phosphoribosylpyrophosphate synthetase
MYGLNIDVTPSNVLGVVKRDLMLSSGVHFTMSDDDRRLIAERLAKRIAAKFAGKVDVVVPTASSRQFVKVLANFVGEALDVPVESVLSKPADVETFKYDRTFFDGENTTMLPPAREKLRQRLERQEKKFAKMIEQGRTPTSEDFDVGTRRYYNLQKLSSVTDEYRNLRVLVVDDNVREGLTINKLRNEFAKQGCNDVATAVGYRLLMPKDSKKQVEKIPEPIVIDTTNVVRVNVGTVVTLLDVNATDEGNAISYALVPADEALDVGRGVIPINSRIGAILRGKEQGDEVKLGSTTFEILNVSVA